MGKKEGSHNINNGLAKVQHMDKAQPGSHCSLWQSCFLRCGTADPLSNQAVEWPWLYSFLFWSSHRFGVHGGCPMCWEPRAFSLADRALCLLCC